MNTQPYKSFVVTYVLIKGTKILHGSVFGGVAKYLRTHAAQFRGVVFDCFTVKAIVSTDVADESFDKNCVDSTRAKTAC